MSYNKFVMRKVRHGRVKIGGEWYYPKDAHRAYNGECDGQWFLFGRYRTGDRFEPFVSLWGSKAMAEADGADETELKRAMDAVRHTETNILDGTIYWMFWEART